MTTTQQTFERYVSDALAGRIIIGDLVRKALQRHERDMLTAAERGLRFDWDAAHRACEFFARFLVHSKGKYAGQPFELSGWQVFIVGSVFGWKWIATGRRRYRTAYIEVSRKQGKSTLAGGVALYALVADDEPGAEIYSLATKREQAKIVFTEAQRMVRSSPQLRKLVERRASSLVVSRTDSKFEPLGRDADSLDGLNIHVATLDELHAHKNRDLLEVIDTATGARTQPLLFCITTAGARRSGVGWDEHCRAERIVTGVADDDSVFVFVAALDEKDDIFDEKVWPKACPNLGVSCELEQIRIAARKAKDQSTARAAFARYYCGRWGEESITRWIPHDRWQACKENFSERELEGRECFAGLDLAGTRDLSALTLLFPNADDESARILCYAWAPREGTEERARVDRVPYLQWADAGQLKLTDSVVTDQNEILADVAALRQRFDIKQCAFDRFQASWLVSHLEAISIECLELPMTFTGLGKPTSDTEKLVLAKALQHDGNPLLAWAFSNVVCVTDDAGNVRPSKKRSRERIDPAVSTILAVAAWKYGGAGGFTSVYETRGIESL